MNVFQAYNDPAPSPELAVLFSGHHVCPPKHYFSALRNHCIMHYVVEGEGSLLINNRDYQLSAGDLFFIFPEQRNKYQASEDAPWTYRWIAFGGTQAEDMLSSILITRINPVLSIGPEYTRELDNKFQKVYQCLKNRQAGFHLQSMSVFLDILYSLVENNQIPIVAKRSAAVRTPAGKARQPVDYVKAAQRIIQSHYHQPITITHIARLLGIHRSHLSRSFSMKTGQTVQTCLIEKRMEKACELLVYNNDPMYEVAHSVGYVNYEAFEKRFRKLQGMSPFEYRRLHRGHDPGLFIRKENTQTD